MDAMKEAVFIAGPRAISRLPEAIISRLNTIIQKGFTVLVGDANGVDKAIQKHFAESGYKNVIVYVSGDRPRNNLGEWEVNFVHVEPGIKGFDFYAQKDKKMASDATYGLMLWNGESKGTFSNIVNLTKQGKKVAVYFTPSKTFYTLKDIEQTKKLLMACEKDTQKLLLPIMEKATPKVSVPQQISLFDKVRV